MSQIGTSGDISKKPWLFEGAHDYLVAPAIVVVGSSEVICKGIKEGLLVVRAEEKMLQSVHT